LEQPGWALVEIVCLWISILLTIIWFLKLSKVAGWLLVPYLCWVSFAALLNYEIWRLN
jgi:tryptophan-rich sensory protein